MRIEIKPSAQAHLITDVEIRTVVEYPEVRIVLTSRPGFEDAQPVLFVARAADNEPHVEVIADLAEEDVAEVFHAMMLRPSVVKDLGLEVFIDPEYGPQRA